MIGVFGLHVLILPDLIDVLKVRDPLVFVVIPWRLMWPMENRGRSPLVCS